MPAWCAIQLRQASLRSARHAVAPASKHCAAADAVLEPFATYRRSTMPVRLKKLIGTVLLVILVCVYAVVATLFAVSQLGESGALVHLAYFFFTGLLWILPAMGIIKWMVREPKPRL
jgi:hypothetical protein